ncbi:hypothetical protein [Desertivirga arenae]|uniref:hypothetical protein n=1 Tax=Desertivirga arenae TaxID=2810309 RepID=UPI001A9760BC|nr:hypothetical protein [Pedobacter sp. SYSU D00823]
MELFTLIHVSRNEQSIHNNFVTSLKSQILLYLSCARQLAEGLKNQGVNLHVITNEEEYLRNLMPDYPFPIIQLQFKSVVPSGVKFFSAHFKLEVITYLASLDNEYVGLIDSDVVCVNDIPYSLRTAIDKRIPLYYDITSQVGPAYGLKNIIENKEKLLLERSLGLWAGGEFIAGPPSFFKKLDAEIASIREAYFANIQGFHHQGDEMITSIAIEKLKRTESILDAGALMIIGRFWSVKPKHYQNSINAYHNHFLLHLPSDKRFLVNNRTNSNGAFFREYKRYLIRKRVFRSIFSSMFPLIKYAIMKLSGPSEKKLALK